MRASFFTHIACAQIIQDYILDAMAPDSPLKPPSAEGRAKAAIVTRYMDLYYAPNAVRCRSVDASAVMLLADRL